MLHTVSKAGRVLGLFSMQKPEWGVSEIAKALDMPKSTTSELLATLADQGLLLRTHERSYRLGWLLMELSHTLLNTTEFYPEAHQGLQTLVERWQESGSLNVFSKTQVMCIERLQVTPTVQVLLSQLGMRLPLHASASGKVLLAHQEWPEVKTLVAGLGLTPLTPNTIASRDVLMHELEQIREQGYAYDREEVILGLCTVSAPIRNMDGEVTACISILLPTKRFNEQAANYTDIILRAASSISEQMGYREKAHLK